jgi:hypothetical protein
VRERVVIYSMFIGIRICFNWIAALISIPAIFAFLWKDHHPYHDKHFETESDHIFSPGQFAAQDGKKYHSHGFLVPQPRDLHVETSESESFTFKEKFSDSQSLSTRTLDGASDPTSSYQNINLGTASGGILVNGLSSAQQIGNIVTILGDINGDGCDDMMVATVNTLYVIFGTSSTSNVNLATFTSSQGFTITGYFPANWFYAKYTAISGIGDINNDGLVDMIFGSVNPSTSVATFYILLGAKSFTNLDTSYISSFAAVFSINDVVMVSNNYCGISVGSAGDFNGDGINDIVIGIAPYSGSDGSTYIVYGSSDLSSLTIPLTSSQGITITGPRIGLYWSLSGYSVSGAGDVNGDGFADVVIGAPRANNAGGMAFVVYGSSNPTDLTLTSLTLSQGFAIYGSGTPSSNSVYGDYAGFSVSNAGDFNNDGYADVVIGASYVNSQTGEIFIIYGSNTMSANIFTDAITGEQGMKIFGANSGDYAGFSLCGGSDLNNDGIADIVIGAIYANGGLGGAYVIYGSKTPLPVVHLASLSASIGYAIIGVGYYGYTGLSVSSSGDFNRDGYKDILVGAPYFNNINGNTKVFYVGSAYIVFGQDSGQNSFNLAGVSAINQLNSGTVSATVVSIPGDINLDGYLDVVVGVPSSNSYTGSAYVMYGGKNGFRSIPRVDQMQLSQGFSITGTSAGDKLGSSVSGAGDVNADGIQDFIVGAPYATNTVGNAYILYGANATNRPNLLLSSLTSQDGIKLTGVSAGDSLGWSVSNAGDFDGDGYDDVIIGAPHASDVGVSYIIFGSPNISTYTINLAMPSKYFITIQGAADTSLSGYSVGGAGDFNNDGYDDVIIGAPYEGGSGVAYIVFGSNVRQDVFLANITVSGEGIKISGENSGDITGLSVGGTLDVNGDGYADVVIGAPHANEYAGSSYVVFGSIHPTNVKLSSLANQGFAIYGEAYSQFGHSVSSAGDVNNDGYPDVILGAYYRGSYTYGSTYIIYGGRSPTNVDLANLANSQGISIDGSITNQQSGSSVACAADKYGNALAVIGTLNSNNGAFYTIAPTAVMPTTKTIAPTAIPTHFPTPFPTCLPTKAPPPTFWDQNGPIILGVIVPSLFGFVPIYFSKQICFYVLDHWDSSDHSRGLFKITIYGMCKRVFLADYVEAKENKEKKKELASQNQRLLEPDTNPSMNMEAADSSEQFDIEMAPLSQPNAVVNPMLESSSSSDSAARPINDDLDLRHPLERPSEREPQRIHGPDSDDDEDYDDIDPYRMDVVVKAVYQIRYDNPLLNHPRLLDMLLEARRSADTKAMDRLLSYHAHQPLSASDELSSLDEALSPADASDNMQTISYTYGFKSSDLPQHDYHTNAVYALLSTRDIIDYLPLAYHLSYRCSMLMKAVPTNITVAAYQYHWLVDEKFLFSSHLVIGLSASMLLHDRSSIVQASSSSIVASGLFSLRLRATGYLNDWRAAIVAQDDSQSSRGGWAKAQYCLASAIIHTAPSLAICPLRFLGYTGTKLYPGSSFCQLSDVGLKLAIASSDCAHTLFTQGRRYNVATFPSYLIHYILACCLVMFMLMRSLKIKLFSRRMVAVIMIADQLSSLSLRITYRILVWKKYG